MAYRNDWYSFGEPIFEKKMRRIIWQWCSTLLVLASVVTIGWSVKVFCDEQLMLAYAWSLAAWALSWAAWMTLPNG